MRQCGNDDTAVYLITGIKHHMPDKTNKLESKSSDKPDTKIPLLTYIETYKGKSNSSDNHSKCCQGFPNHN